jgi:hypothetical protein
MFGFASTLLATWEVVVVYAASSAVEKSSNSCQGPSILRYSTAALLVYSGTTSHASLATALSMLALLN